MATAAQWLAGARPRTLTAAVAPVLAGTGVAAHYDGAQPFDAVLALVVAVSLQVGVNYANDYSDGVRGTDRDRVGPLRLVGSGVASPSSVKRAAMASFAVAAVVGLVLAATTSWWLIGLGVLCILAGWFYTGGSSPYGYRGLGEVAVFVFFGLVAVMGTTYVQTESLSGDVMLVSLYAAVGIGALACAILVANNLRDIPTDAAEGKSTLAVVLGDSRTRAMYLLLLAVPAVALVALALATTWWVLVAFAYLIPVVPSTRTVGRRTTGAELVPVLQATGVGELVYGLGIFAGLLA